MRAFFFLIVFFIPQAFGGHSQSVEDLVWSSPDKRKIVLVRSFERLEDEDLYYNSVELSLNDKSEIESVKDSPVVRIKLPQNLQPFIHSEERVAAIAIQDFLAKSEKKEGPGFTRLDSPVLQNKSKNADQLQFKFSFMLPQQRGCIPSKRQMSLEWAIAKGKQSSGKMSIEEKKKTGSLILHSSPFNFSDLSIAYAVSAETNLFLSKDGKLLILTLTDGWEGYAAFPLPELPKEQC